MNFEQHEVSEKFLYAFISTQTVSVPFLKTGLSTKAIKFVKK